VVGGGWQLVVGGGWQLVAVGGWWQLAVGSGRSLGAVLEGCSQQKKLGLLNDTPGVLTAS